MPESAAIRRGAVLAFDFGEKRIGVAVGEYELTQAHPLTTIRSEVNRERFSTISALIEEWKPATLVVGLPVALDGSPHEMTARCTRFANQLRGRFGVPVAYAEERLSSVEAEEKLRGSGLDSRNARTHIDEIAAQIILQSYFEHLPKDRTELPCP